MGAYKTKKNYLAKENFTVGKRGLTKTADRLKEAPYSLVQLQPAL